MFHRIGRRRREIDHVEGAVCPLNLPGYDEWKGIRIRIRIRGFVIGGSVEGIV